ncbi:DMT family transporter, partial [Muricomes intestini]|uniref:DMT family transporter n=1 Tax=Muricomes intestini TaxID=1796634 RepID=UPI002FDCDF90
SHTEEKKGDRKTLWIGGIYCGIALAAGSSLQQVGLVYTSAGKAGFLTALYILIVPLLGIFVGKRAGIKIWTGVGLAMLGIFFLCVKEGFSIVHGDLLIMVSALAFAVHILVIDYFAPKVDGVKMSCIQFLVCGVLCAVPMLIWERPAAGAILDAYVPLLYAGVLSCGAAYTMQVVAQKDADPTVASLILSLESVFAALTSWLILHEKRTPRELFGCALVFLAIILAQLPAKNLRTGKSLKCEASSEINKETEQFEAP